MRFVFLTGGATGFVIAAGTDYFLGRDPQRVLFDGAVGCLAGALLFRWYWNVLLRGIRDTYLARHRQALAATAAASAAASAAATSAAPAPAAKTKP